eukprot:s3736_g9.t1
MCGTCFGSTGRSVVEARLEEVLQATSNIVGMEGHRSQIRLRGHAAGWHYGSRRTWQTCVRRCYLQLHLPSAAETVVEECRICLDSDLETPVLSNAVAMRRIVAKNPDALLCPHDDIFFEQVLGILPPLKKESYRIGLPATFEDGVASSLQGGIFVDVASLSGQLETQGRGSMSNPVAQVVMRCTVDVKYLGRAFAEDDLARFCDGTFVSEDECAVADVVSRSADASEPVDVVLPSDVSAQGDVDMEAMQERGGQGEELAGTGKRPRTTASSAVLTASDKKMANMKKALVRSFGSSCIGSNSCEVASEINSLTEAKKNRGRRLW